MANSSYYYDLMQRYSHECQDIKSKKSEYENCLKALNNLLSSLTNLPNSFEEAEKKYENGGFLSDGVTLSKGLLREDGNNILDIISLIKSVIEKTENQIIIYNSKIDNLNRDYDSAQDNYYRALKEESGEK